MSALAAYPELQKLTNRQKCKLADELWASAMNTGDKTPVPESHKKALDARLAAYRSGKTKRISFEEMERIAFAK